MMDGPSSMEVKLRNQNFRLRAQLQALHFALKNGTSPWPVYGQSMLCAETEKLLDPETIPVYSQPQLTSERGE